MLREHEKRPKKNTSVENNFCSVWAQMTLLWPQINNISSKNPVIVYHHHGYLEDHQAHLCLINGIFTQFAAATAANGTNLPISGGAL